MMKRRLLMAVLAPVLALTGTGAVMALSATPAFAITCNSSNTDDHQGFGWSHTTSGTPDVMGVRAGVKFMKDSALCDYDPANPPWNAVYLAVIGNGGTESITQMGFIHDYVVGTNQWCEFWATKDTGAHAQNYGCTGYAVDDWENFSVHQDSTFLHYVLSDCGQDPSPDDFSNCTVKNSSASDFTTPTGQIAIEEFNGSCGMHEWGYSGDNERIGSATGSLPPIQGLDDSTLWSARDWGTKSDDDSCSNGGGSGGAYNWFDEDSGPVHGVKWFDGRNSS